MRRESHVRFCEGGGVRLPSATRLRDYNAIGTPLCHPGEPKPRAGEPDRQRRQNLPRVFPRGSE